MKILVLHGPNLNLLGTREPGIYGSQTLENINTALVELGKELGVEVFTDQSNHEGTLIDWFHEANDKAAGVAIIAGAYTHTSIALHDAIKAISIPVIELHISNVHAREEFRHKSMIAPACKGVIAGFGPHSYILALQALKNLTA